MLLIPKLTSVNDGAFLADDTLLGRLRARRRLAADRAGQDRQARLRRELRHGRARPQGAQARAGRCAVGRAAPDEGQGRDVVARQPARRAAAPGGQRRRRPDVQAADPAARRPGAGRDLPAGAGDRPGPALRRCRRGARGCRTEPAGGWRRCSPGWCSWWPVRSPPRSQPSPSGCSSDGSSAPTTRCGARSSGATSWPTRSSRSVAAPWFARAATGTPVLNVWLRTMGARIGRRLVRDLLAARGGPGRPAGRRHGQPGMRRADPPVPRPVLSMDTVTLRAGSTLGPNSVILPAATLGRARYGRPGVVGDARRVGARPDPLDRQPHRAVAEDDVVTARGERTAPTPTSPGHGDLPSTSSTTTSPSTTG